MNPGRFLDDCPWPAPRALAPPVTQDYDGSGSYGPITGMGWVPFLAGICPPYDSGLVTTLAQWDAYRAGMEVPVL